MHDPKKFWEDVIDAIFTVALSGLGPVGRLAALAVKAIILRSIDKLAATAIPLGAAPMSAHSLIDLLFDTVLKQFDPDTMTAKLLKAFRDIVLTKLVDQVWDALVAKGVVPGTPLLKAFEPIGDVDSDKLLAAME